MARRMLALHRHVCAGNRERLTVLERLVSENRAQIARQTAEIATLKKENATLRTALAAAVLDAAKPRGGDGYMAAPVILPSFPG
jgi:cell division protein FtsB